MEKMMTAREWYISGRILIRNAIDGLKLDMEEKFSSDDMLVEALEYEGIIGYTHSIKHLFEDLYEEEEFTFEFDELRSFCIEHDYFTAGTNEQYEKMFRKAEYGIKLSELALIIDMCSEHTTESDILGKLIKLVESRTVEEDF